MFAVQDFINRSNHELDVREQGTVGVGMEKDLSFAKVGLRGWWCYYQYR